jgi:hypothetical protein
MAPKQRSVRTHNNGQIVVTIHQFGDDGPFGCDFSHDIQVGVVNQARVLPTFASLAEVQAFADKRLRDEGHTCNWSCTEWRATSWESYESIQGKLDAPLR